MKKKLVVIGGLATAVVLAGGWALAQPQPHGPGGFGPPFMHGKGLGGMGPGMMQHMARGMDHGMMQHMGLGHGTEMMHGPAGAMFADPARIEALKTELGVTPAQETAWTSYAKSVQDAASAMKTMHKGVDHDTVSKLSPAEHLALMTKIREQAQKQFETVKTAADELLATLDDTQKAKARGILPGLPAFGPGQRGAMAGARHRH